MWPVCTIYQITVGTQKHQSTFYRARVFSCTWHNSIAHFSIIHTQTNGCLILHAKHSSKLCFPRAIFIFHLNLPCIYQRFDYIYRTDTQGISNKPTVSHAVYHAPKPFSMTVVINAFIGYLFISYQHMYIYI